MCIHVVRYKKNKIESTVLVNLDSQDNNEEVTCNAANADENSDTTLPTANGKAAAISDSTDEQTIFTNFHEENVLPKQSTPIVSRKNTTDSLIVTPVSDMGTPTGNVVVGEREKQNLLLSNQHVVARKAGGPSEDTVNTIRHQQLPSFQNSPRTKKDFKTG